MALLQDLEPGGVGAIEALAVALSYLLGSVPFGLVLGRLIGGVDIRSVGSGNIGATNVGRALGRGWALAAFLLDCGKGFLPAFWLGPLAASAPGREPLLAILCGAAAVVGHVWPLFLRFRGGKAVATTSGVVIGIDPLVFLGGGLAWLAAAAATRFVGLASIAMAAAFVVLFAWRSRTGGYGAEVVWGSLGIALLILARHRANISRMLAGTEPRIGRGAGPGAGKRSRDGA